jgi:hypothetical protein
MKKIAAIALAVMSATSAYAEMVDMSTYTNVFYVSESGSDDNDGSENSPFETVAQAIIAAGDSGDAIYISAGQYDITYTGFDAEYNSGVYNRNTGLNNAGKDVDFIGEAGETILYINGADIETRDVYFYSGTGYSNIYGMTFIRDSDGRAYKYSNAFFSTHESTPVQGAFYNTVFQSLNAERVSLVYSNASKAEVSVYNSVFDVDGAFWSSYSGAGDGVLIKDSVTNASFPYGDGSVVFDNALSNVEWGDNYEIEGESTAGIYSGSYSWVQASNVNAPVAFSALALFGVAFMRKRKQS